VTEIAEPTDSKGSFSDDDIGDNTGDWRSFIVANAGASVSPCGPFPRLGARGLRAALVRCRGGMLPGESV
jgi:hypothetical protein